jgi:hypothetical protein
VEVSGNEKRLTTREHIQKARIIFEFDREFSGVAWIGGINI